ncbi:unnamed protein product [Oncorhynchus mykiss]|uniref:EGF-like domain-containing protein n=1 Tax=Oncorhynchus mykiss TaxID=8022 RepID=A0A060WSV8_ONCMY|nr:unnamed protein product [Oncorhynchus mykiss]
MRMPVPTQRPLYLLLLLLSAGVGGLSSPLDLEPPAPEAAAPIEADPTQATPLPDPCEGRPCLNGGACSAQPSDPETEDTLPNTWAYSCTCTSGSTGRNCEFFTDPCANSPCFHGNCSRSGESEEYTCECSEGYEGEKCEQGTLDLLPVSNWDPATPPAPEQATPATPTTATQPSQPTTVSSTTQAPPTLQPWQPKAGQRLLVVQWEKEQQPTSAQHMWELLQDCWKSIPGEAG